MRPFNRRTLCYIFSRSSGKSYRSGMTDSRIPTANEPRRVFAGGSGGGKGGGKPGGGAEGGSARITCTDDLKRAITPFG
jgi:hypothetical protein